MGTFFKTFFICLIAVFSFLVYKCFSTDGFSPSLNVSANSPVFGNHKSVIYDKNDIQNEEIVPEEKVTESEQTKPEEKANENKDVKYKHTCYFYSAKGELVPLTRELSTKPTLKSVILILLKGPMIAETKKGIYSEIPANVDLISVKNIDDRIIVNLSSNFGNGGGSESIENRVKQLAKTIKNYAPGKKIYLHINGKEVEYLGGEGVYIKQPLE